MSTSAPNQTLRCVGEIRVDTTGDASKEAKGTIRFVDQTSTNFGQLRVYGFGGQGELVMDVLGVTEGFNVKTINTQGSATFGGNGEPYAFRVKGEEARCKYLTLSSTRSNYNKQTGINQLNVTRDSTVDSSTTLTSTLGTFTQGEFKFGEGIFTNIGSSSNGRAWFGWRTPLASTSASTNYGVLGMTTTSNISTFVENIKLNTDSSVNIPDRLDVGTIYATNYLNLPPTPTPNLNPITLDQINNLVGINQPIPQHALDLVGDFGCTGRIAAESSAIKIGKWTGSSEQGDDTVAIGYGAGETKQGTSSVALGVYAGNTNQGNSSVAIGNLAGYYYQSGGVAIGYEAAYSTQALEAIAIGSFAGYSTQGSYAVSLGYSAGETRQGAESIAIGRLAGNIDQHSNSIILNATGTKLNSDGSFRTYIAPLREVANDKTVQYNATSKEVTYSDTLTTAGTGTPEGVVTKPVGRLFLRTDGNGTDIPVLYVKCKNNESNLGWLPVSMPTSYKPSWSFVGINPSLGVAARKNTLKYNSNFTTSGPVGVGGDPYNSGTVIIQRTGRYRIAFYATCTGKVDRPWIAEIRVNGNSRCRSFGENLTTSANFKFPVSMTMITDLVANDVLTVFLNEHTYVETPTIAISMDPYTDSCCFSGEMVFDYNV